MAEPRGLKPFVKELDAGGEAHLPLLGEGFARRLRAGMVTLAASSSCGRHSTEDYEELLVILEGRGEAEVEGHRTFEVAAGQVLYIPPRTYHNVTNNGAGELRYIYVVAPA